MNRTARRTRLSSVASLACLVTALAMLSAHAFGAEGWPTHRADNTRGGVTADSVQTPLSLRWMYESIYPPKTAWGAPAEELPRSHYDSAFHVAAIEGTVYFGSSVDHSVFAVDAETGEIRWRFFTDGPVRLAPTVEGDRLYFGSDDGFVYCLNRADGIPIWTYRAGPTAECVMGNGRIISRWPVRTNILLDGGIAYFCAGVFPYEGLYICALDASDGTVVWTNDTIGDRGHELIFGGFAPQGYLVVSDNALYVPSGRAMPAVFDRHTGQFLRYLSPTGKVGGTWTLLDQGQVIAGVDRSGDPAKVAYDEKTGESAGDAYAWFPGIELAITPSTSYSLTHDGIYAIDRATYPTFSKTLGSIGDKRNTLGKKLTALRKERADYDADTRAKIDAQIDSIVRQMSELERLQTDLKNQMACEWRYSRTDLTTIIRAGDVVFAGGEGVVVAVDAQDGLEQWSHAVDGKVCGLGASAGCLFVSTDTGSIYCFGEGETATPKTIAVDREENPYFRDKLSDLYQAAAEKIVSESGIHKGWALVLDAGTGRLAYELAKRTELSILAVIDEPERQIAARQALEAAGLLGNRVVVGDWDIATLPEYFANLIVSDGLLTSGEMAVSAHDVFRVLRPSGGVALFGRPTTGSQANLDTKQLVRWLKAADGPNPEVLKKDGAWVKLTRGELEGAGSWSELYGEPGNTANSGDDIVQGTLGVLWYGDPGPQKMVERHGRAVSPVAINGLMFVQGADVIMGIDAYNGTLLWERDLPGAVRVRVDADGGNLSATEEGLYLAAHDKCYRLDPMTGEIVRVYDLPTAAEGTRRWGYISCVDGILYGTEAKPLEQDYASTWDQMVENGEWIPSESMLEEYGEMYTKYLARFTEKYPVPNEAARADFQRSGILWRPIASFPTWGTKREVARITDKLMAGDAFFALDAETGKTLWVHRGKRIANISVAIGNGTVFLTDATETGDDRNAAMQWRKTAIAKGIYEPEREEELMPQGADVRRAYALDAKTGKKRWEKVMDFTGCGGDHLGAIYSDGVLITAGCFSNHDTGMFNSGSLKWRRITAIDTKNGNTLWSKPLNYLRRPLVIDGKIVIEPRACDLRTGDIVTRKHPITGEEVPWEFLRPGHCCAVSSSSTNSLFYRSYNAAFYDFKRDSGVTYFGAIRPGCWINMIPASGLLLFPEASSGCTCAFPLRCSVALKPKRDQQEREWSIFVTHGQQSPVKRLGINFGAPGDMKDGDGELWFGYPRPNTTPNSLVGLYGVQFTLSETVKPGMGFFSHDFVGAKIEGIDKPWLMTSGCVGLQKCSIPLIDDTWGEEPGRYTVRLGFIAPEGDRAGQRVFDLKLQGKTVLEGFDLYGVAGGTGKTVVKTFKRVDVKNALTLELAPQGVNPSKDEAPIVNFVEVVREGRMPSKKSAAVAKKLDFEEVKALLKKGAQAKAKKNVKTALESYHAVLTATADADALSLALEGMASIGSPASLPYIEQYCRADSPILFGYDKPDQRVLDGAVLTFLAVAENVAEESPDKAGRMFEQAVVMPCSTEVRTEAADRLANMGVDIGAEAAAEGYLTRWRLVGPFAWDEQKYNIDWEFINEPKIDLAENYTFKGKTLRWTEFASDRGMIDLTKLFKPDFDVSSYAYAEFELPQAQDVLLKVGSNDDFKCWMNGKLAGRFDGGRGWAPDQDILKVEGKKGVNGVLVKITQSGGNWAFSVRVTDTENAPVGTQK